MSDTTKKIVFVSTNTNNNNKHKHAFKYASKLKSGNVVNSSSVKSSDTFFDARYYTYPLQLDIVAALYKHLTDNTPFPIQLDAICEQVMRHIQTKVSGYRMQDKLKKRPTGDDFIDTYRIARMLWECKCGCHYCKRDVFVLYKNTQEMHQWTLDRLDNSVAHSINNVVVSCLECNLKKGCKGEDAFIFTKQLAVTKRESNDINDVKNRDKLYDDTCDIDVAEMNRVMSISDIEYSQDS